MKFLVPDLLMIYKKYVRPEWRTYEMLLKTEIAMHGAVRKTDGRADPPMLLVTKKGPRRLIVDCHSKRRMAGVAVGIIRGIAKHYDEATTRRSPALQRPRGKGSRYGWIPGLNSMGEASRAKNTPAVL